VTERQLFAIKYRAYVGHRAERQSAQMSKNYEWRLNQIWDKIYSCAHMATVGVKGLS